MALPPTVGDKTLWVISHAAGALLVDLAARNGRRDLPSGDNTTRRFEDIDSALNHIFDHRLLVLSKCHLNPCSRYPPSVLHSGIDIHIVVGTLQPFTGAAYTNSGSVPTPCVIFVPWAEEFPSACRTATHTEPAVETSCVAA